MNKHERDKLRDHYKSYQYGTTHTLGCYSWHPACAVIQLLDELDNLEEVMPVQTSSSSCSKCGEKL